MNILAIETSCDETGVTIARVSENGDIKHVEVLADMLLSQAQQHAQYGGVYPTLAKRKHAKNLVPLTLEALKSAGMLESTSTPDIPQEVVGEIKELLEREPELFVHLVSLIAQTSMPHIDAIAVTHGPGLAPALWVGVNFARALSIAWGIPIIPVHHMEGHIATALVTQESGKTFTLTPPPTPALALLISGGHTQLVLMRGGYSYEVVGNTRDDAVGEAFDKSARLLGIPYPGGPEISRLAREAREEQLEQPFSLPRPMINDDSLDFSFSGLKTAVRNLIESLGEVSEVQKKQIARELEDAIADTLAAKVERAVDTHGARALVVGGGVAANTHINERLTALTQRYENVSFYISSPKLSTDNGIMIALAGSLHLNDVVDAQNIEAHGNLPLY